MTRRMTTCLTWDQELTLCKREKDEARPAGEYSSDTHEPRPRDVCIACWAVLRREMSAIGAAQ